MSFKEDIIKLREEGKTYKEIVSTLGCSMGVVCYHLGSGQKKKDSERHYKQYRYHPIYSKIQSFIKGSENRLTVQEVLDKIGPNPHCYLTGVSIDLRKSSTYQLDHIIPRSRGGNSSIDNLGLLSTVVNKAKHNLIPDELIMLCQQIIDFKQGKIQIQKYNTNYLVKEKRKFFSDDEIIEEAIKFFISNGNKIWERLWFRHSQVIGLPQTYSKIRFGGGGYKTMIRMLQNKLTERGVSWSESDFILSKSERYNNSQP